MQKNYLKSKSEVEANKHKTTLSEHLKHMSWCLKNNIIIYFEPINWREGQIVINDNDNIQRSSQIYNQTKLRPKDDKYWEIIFQLYTKFYKQRSNE